jgi:isopentenyldiphosphate isomerase
MDPHETNFLIDVVNRQDVPVLYIPRLLALELGFKTVRTVAGFIKNPLGQLWIPRRSGNVTIYKHALDFSVAGYVHSTWTYEQQLYYKLETELGLDPQLHAYWPIAHLSPFDHGTSCFTKVFEIRATNVANFDPHEFESWEWLYPQQLLERLERGEPHKSDLLVVLRHLIATVSFGDAP